MNATVSGLVIAAAAAWLALGPQDPPAGKYAGNCTDAACHATLTKGTVVHGPVESGVCDACHEPQEGRDHKFAFVAEGGDLCFECHDEFEGKVPHAPAADGDCIACHNPHASETPSLLREATVADQCFECHDDFSEEFDFLHGPVAAGACTTCHDPHAAEHARLLSTEGIDLCLRCHETMADRMGTSAYKHAPATEDCTACHHPHGADNKMMLTETAPSLCLGCHEDIEELLDDAGVTHAPVTSGRACLKCHNPHATDFERILLSDPMDLCLSCHNATGAASKSDLTNMAALLAENPDHHGPIRDKNCTGCHSPHGSAHFRMLHEPYPAAFYAPFAKEQYGLCFGCHELDMVLDEQTDSLTDFRNGQRNLHYLHVNRTVKGRTCRACHETHASTKPRHIRKAVPFGTWELPVNFQKSAGGGSCAPGCHKRYRYDRTTAIVNVPAAKSTD